VPRFYFHLCDGTGFVEDEEGSLFANAEAARRAAVQNARGVMTGDVARGQLDLTSFIEVEDENHALLFTLHFKDALQVKASDRVG
jgi:hypothetical protein